MRGTFKKALIVDDTGDVRATVAMRAVELGMQARTPALQRPALQRGESTPPELVTPPEAVEASMATKSAQGCQGLAESTSSTKSILAGESEW